MPKKRILVIDDEPNLCTVVQACLENLADWEVIASFSADEGMRLAITYRPDAILLDVMMPEIDGIAVFKKLQANAETEKIPVILLTAKVMPVDLAKFARLDTAGVIPKPFNPLTLVETIAKLLRWSD